MFMLSASMAIHGRIQKEDSGSGPPSLEKSENIGFFSNMGKQSPRCSPALWAIVTTDLCIRRCRTPSNNVTPINTFDEQPPLYICF